MSGSNPPDVVVVGAGVMGCASAFELARRGLSVHVLERSVPGAEASSAAAGMLAAQVEADGAGPFSSLCLASRERFSGWATRLHAETGIDVEHRVCGVLRAAFNSGELAALEAHAGGQRERGLAATLWTAKEAHAHEPSLSREVLGAAYFPDDARVDPPRYLRALRIAAGRAGARFTSGAMVRRVIVEDGRARGIEVEGGELILADHVVIAAGSWSNLVPGVPLGAAAVRPARGQIVELSTPLPLLRGIVWGPEAYLSPRDDGRILIGSTLEFVGFERAVTAGAVRDLLGAAIQLVPGLAGAELVRCWSSFRPYTPDELPLLGPSSIERLWLATGHFRNGILLSPITAEIIAACITGQPPPVDLAPFLQR